MDHRIDIQLLATFCTIAEERSFVAAAQRFGRTEAAISMQIKRLEALLGDIKLFKRTSRGSLITSHGATLLPYAHRVLVAHEEFALIANVLDNNAPVRIGVPEDYVESIMHPVIDQFSTTHPDFEIRVTCDRGEVLSKLIAEQKLDIAVTTRGTIDNCRFEVLRDEPIVWVAPPQIPLEKEGVIPLAVFEPTETCRAVAVASCLKSGIKHRVAFSSSSFSGVVALVRQGLAITALARCAVPRDLRILPDDAGMPTLPSLTLTLITSQPTVPRQPIEALTSLIRKALKTCISDLTGPCL